MNKICVFCGSSMGHKKEYETAAFDLGNFFAKNNIELIYGGANVGLMKIIADVLLSKKTKVTGIMPHLLIEKEVAHKGIDEMIEVDSMAIRKEKMIELSEGFIALPGGLGTLDEISEILTHNQLRISDKPLGLLNTLGYFDKLLDFLDHAVAEGYVRKEHRRNIIVSDNIEELINKMNAYSPVTMGKWIEDIKEESRN